MQYRTELVVGIEADSPEEAAQAFSELLAANGVRRIVVRVADATDDSVERFFDGYGSELTSEDWADSIGT